MTQQVGGNRGPTSGALKDISYDYFQHNTASILIDNMAASNSASQILKDMVPYSHDIERSVRNILANGVDFTLSESWGGPVL